MGNQGLPQVRFHHGGHQTLPRGVMKVATRTMGYQGSLEVYQEIPMVARGTMGYQGLLEVYQGLTGQTATSETIWIMQKVNHMV